MTRILIADMHAAFRTALLLYIASEYPAIYVGQVNSQQTLMEKTREQQWSIIFLDIKLYGMKGKKIIHQVKTAFPETAIFLTGMFAEGIASQNLAEHPGIAGYLSKYSMNEALHAIIEKNSAGTS